jgi:glycosyltransferase involved in cell wall biosynthesis
MGTMETAAMQSDASGRPEPEPLQPAPGPVDTSMPAGDWPARGSVPVSVLVTSKNEQANIVSCLRRLLFANEVVLVDSQSTDQTVRLAQALGAEVYQFYMSPRGWPQKRNWALETLTWRNEWVLIVDADEHMTPELACEIEQVVNGQYRPENPRLAGCGDGYCLNRRFMFMGRWIRHCGYYPSYNLRLFKHRVGRYERIGPLGDTGSGDNEVHEHVVLSTGEPGFLQHDFLHYAYPDLGTFVEKHNRYANWEAHAMAEGFHGGRSGSLFGGSIDRRRWIKQKTQRLPFRPTLRFIYSYVLQRGFLDGYPGFILCRMLAWYELLSLAKYRELHRRAQHDASQEDGHQAK